MPQLNQNMSPSTPPKKKKKINKKIIKRIKNMKILKNDYK